MPVTPVRLDQLPATIARVIVQAAFPGLRFGASVNVTAADLGG